MLQARIGRLHVGLGVHRDVVTGCTQRRGDPSGAPVAATPASVMSRTRRASRRERGDVVDCAGAVDERRRGVGEYGLGTVWIGQGLRHRINGRPVHGTSGCEAARSPRGVDESAERIVTTGGVGLPIRARLAQAGRRPRGPFAASVAVDRPGSRLHLLRTSARASAARAGQRAQPVSSGLSLHPVQRLVPALLHRRNQGLQEGGWAHFVSSTTSLVSARYPRAALLLALYLPSSRFTVSVWSEPSVS